MLRKRFLISWISSTIFMFGLSFLWHGFVLNDLENLAFPLVLFVGLSALTYVVIGFVLTFAFTYLSMGIKFKLKGIGIGAALGFFIYLIAFTLGVSFAGSNLEHVVADFCWQMLEQGLGGLIVSLIHKLAERRDKVLGLH